MRAFALVAFLGIFASGLSVPVSAAAEDPCDRAEAWFKLAMDMRIMGESKAKVRRTLQGEMGEKKAANELADFMFLLPDDQLTPQLIQAARAQCEAVPIQN